MNRLGAEIDQLPILSDFPRTTQSRCRDSLIGNCSTPNKRIPNLCVSIPLPGFISRKLTLYILFYYFPKIVSIPLPGFISRKLG